MRQVLGAAATLVLLACGSTGEAPLEGGQRTPGEQRVAPREGALVLEEGAGVVQGSLDGQVRFSSREVEPGVFRVQVRARGLLLAALLDARQGTSVLDGFAEDSGQDTQLGELDREALAALYEALNARLPPSDEATPEAKYLRRVVGLWAQHPGTVQMQRTVMGEQGRGYTMLCSYARCDGKWTGSCNGNYNWYSYARHDCQHGGFDSARNQQVAQLGDHYYCDGDEWYLDGGTWRCGEPDHWYRPKVVGICFGRCGGSCGGDTQYTLDATNHDGCVRNGHLLASAYCDDQFTSASDDELFAPNCY